MSKLSFRARALDPCKPMPIYLAEELPDLPEYSAINRAVPQMPSGMEKEEESEHHLQRAICTGLIIPTPEVFLTESEFYERNYPANYKMPRQLIHMQPLGLEQDIPDYDMDSADELWMNSQARRLDLTPLKFEQMMDKLEKSSGQTVVTLNEAKALLKQDDEVSTAVYDYWLNKRLKTQHPLILSVKTENRSGLAANNPYLAFRRRTEKMQTRKNRKNDETSYEKMLKLRRDLSRAVTLLEMVKKREKTKREQLHLSIEVFEKRYQLRDFSGSVLNELNSTIKSSRPAFAPIYPNQYSHHSSSVQSGNLLTSSGSSQQQQHHHYSASSYHSSGMGVASSVASAAAKRDLDSGSRKEKRQYKKRKHKLPRDKHYSAQNVASPAAVESTISSEDEDLAGSHLMGSEGEDEGLYAFRRNKNCEYHRPLTKGYGNWPWESKEDNGLGDPKYRFTLTSIRHPRTRCVGFARRRVGRGGRVILDRISTNADDLWSQLDYTILNSQAKRKSPVEGGRTEQNAMASLSEAENVSRDINYISSSLNPIAKAGRRVYSNTKCIKRELDPSDSSYSDVVSYSNAYSNLCSRLSDDEATNSSHNRENNVGSISDLLNKIKQEIPDDVDASEDDWMRLSKTAERSPSSSIDQRDSGVVIDLVRTQCINRISNQNISSNNNNNNNLTTSYSSSGVDFSAASRNLFNKRLVSNETNNSIVIRDGLKSVIKREFEVDTNNSDDENVNLASLSNILHAKYDEVKNPTKDNLWTYDHNIFDELNASTKLQNSQNWRGDIKPESQASDSVLDLKGKDDLDDEDAIYKDFLDEIRKNWLHFRPKSPPLPSPSKNSPEDATKGSVNFSEQTQIAIEMQRIDSGMASTDSLNLPSAVFTPKIDSDPMFTTPKFSFNDLAGDDQLLLNTTTDSSNSGIDFNLSGDSLTELNLSLGEDENEKMLENILEECQIDDLKALNQTTTFWDGIWGDGGLLDVIDDKKANIPDSSKVVDLLVNGAEVAILDDKDEAKRLYNKRKDNLTKVKVGSSQFSVMNVSQDEKFFSKDESVSTHLMQESIKCELPEELLEVPQSSQQRTCPNSIASSQLLASVIGSIDSCQSTTSTNTNPNCIGNNNPSIKVVIKQEASTSMASTSATPIVTTINQVPINQLNASQVITTIPPNIKIENDSATFLSNIIRDAMTAGTTTIGSNVVAVTGSIGTSGITVASNKTASANIPSLLMTSIQQQQQQAGQHQTSQQHPQQHIIFRQITQSSQTPQQIQSSGGIVNTGVSSYATDGSGAIVITTNTTTSPTKRQTNGPTEKNALHYVLKPRCANRHLSFIQQTAKQQPHAQQHMKQTQMHQDEDVVLKTALKKQHGSIQHMPHGSLIKIPQLPLIVPELNFQQQSQAQQQTQQQQTNTISTSAAVAIASNHNYSLPPNPQPLAIIGHQQQSGNKIILNTSGASGTVVGGTNFTIATTPIQDISKISCERPSNIKMNLVTNSDIQQGSLIMDAKNLEMVKSSLQQHQQAQITVAAGPQPTQMQHHQRKTVNMFITPEQKRVVCKLVNLSSLQPKNNAGQTVQVSSGPATNILGNAAQSAGQRLINSAFVANVRPFTIVGTGATTAQSSSAGASTDDMSATLKSQTANSTGAGSGGGDATASVVSSGINLNTTNR